jgi:effector-binding domain-containing protein
MRWIEGHGYQPSGPPIEKYLNGPDEVPPAEYRTEIAIPIAPALVAVPA